MKDDYLHKINVDKLSEELKLSADEIAVLAGIKHAKNLGKWAQSKPDGARPNFNALIKLLKAGATVETLFGVEYKGHAPATQSTAQNGAQITPNDLSWAFGEAMKLLQEKKSSTDPEK